MLLISEFNNFTIPIIHISFVINSLDCHLIRLIDLNIELMLDGIILFSIQNLFEENAIDSVTMLLYIMQCASSNVYRKMHML